MKHFILTIAIACLSMIAVAQRHYHSPNIDKFVGTWIYHQNGKEMEITLRIATRKLKLGGEDITQDELEGFEVYKVNGQTVHDSKKDNKVSLSAGLTQDRVDPNLVKINYFDELKQKSGAGTLTFIPGSPDKIKWYLQDNIEGPRLKGEPKHDYRFTIPDMMILERKKIANTPI